MKTIKFPPLPPPPNRQQEFKMAVGQTPSTHYEYTTVPYNKFSGLLQKTRLVNLPMQKQSLFSCLHGPALSQVKTFFNSSSLCRTGIRKDA